MRLHTIIVLLYLYSENETSTVLSSDSLIKNSKQPSTGLFSNLNTWLKYINYLLY